MKKVIFIILAFLMIFSTICLSACAPTGCATIDDALGLVEENPYSQEEDIPKETPETATDSDFKLYLNEVDTFYVPILTGVVKSEFAPLKLLLVLDGKQYDITNIITKKKYIETDATYQTYFTGNLINCIGRLEKKSYDVNILAVREEKEADSGFQYTFICDDEYTLMSVYSMTKNEYMYVLDKESNWTKFY